jgi:hypothetical protein
LFKREDFYEQIMRILSEAQDEVEEWFQDLIEWWNAYVVDLSSASHSLTNIIAKFWAQSPAQLTTLIMKRDHQQRQSLRNSEKPERCESRLRNQVLSLLIQLKHHRCHHIVQSHQGEV